MKILVIDDDIFKREQITDFLDTKKITYKTCLYVNPALKYIFSNNDIAGIILDMGLQSLYNSQDYSLTRGLDVIYELHRRKHYIPVLINSSRSLTDLEKYPFIYGQRSEIDNYQILEDFINFLKQREKQ